MKDKIDKKRIKVEERNYSLETYRGMKEGTFLILIKRHRKGVVGAFYVCSHGKMKFEAQPWSENCEECAKDLEMPFIKRRKKVI
jgi:CRISPR/Cas system CMR-associated protein Cmr3 (group 5 of RAMP superfamily)